MFGFPDAVKPAGFRYKHNFLKTVIFQLKYTQNNNILGSKDSITNILKDKYPNIKNILQGQIQFKLDKTPVIISESNTTDGFEFRSQNGNRIFSITGDTISFTILGNEYVSFESEFSSFSDIIKNISGRCSIDSFSRVAIRKINLFEFQPDDQNFPIDFLPIVFNEQFVSSMLSIPDKKFFNIALMRYELFDNPYNLKLSYGLTSSKKSPPNNKIATLDIDLFNNTSLVQLTNFEEEMKTINQSIYNIFDYIISSELKKIMNS